MAEVLTTLSVRHRHSCLNVPPIHRTRTAHPIILIPFTLSTHRRVSPSPLPRAITPRIHVHLHPERRRNSKRLRPLPRAPRPTNRRTTRQSGVVEPESEPGGGDAQQAAAQDVDAVVLELDPAGGGDVDCEADGDD